VDSAETVVHQEDACTVFALTEIGDATEVDSDRHAESFSPRLGFEFAKVGGAELDGEITAAVSTAVAAVALRVEWQHNQRQRDGAIVALVLSIGCGVGCGVAHRIAHGIA
jgi:hypothetical protein